MDSTDPLLLPNDPGFHRLDGIHGDLGRPKVEEFKIPETHPWDEEIYLPAFIFLLIFMVNKKNVGI